MLKIEKIINKPVPSNTYIIYDTEVDKCLVVDPGTEDCSELLKFVSDKNIQPEFIILTHEHFDHVWGCNTLRDKFGTKIICSKICAEKIGIPQNYFNLLYNNKNEVFRIDHTDIIIEEINYEFDWNGLSFSFINTSGHSSSSICCALNDCLFTGDTIMKGYKPFIKQRHEGSIEELKTSLNFIFNSFRSQEIKVYPGHGECFLLNEVRSQYEEYLIE